MDNGRTSTGLSLSTAADMRGTGTSEDSCVRGITYNPAFYIVDLSRENAVILRSAEGLIQIRSCLDYIFRL